MVTTALCVCWALVFSLTTATLLLDDVTDCSDSKDSDNLCVLEDRFQSCAVSCKLHVRELTLVAEGSRCLDYSSTTEICHQGEWEDAGESQHRAKRSGWWWWKRNPPPERQYYPDISCPGNRWVTAPSGRITAKVSWTVPTASDRNGDTPSVSRTQGPAPGSRFSAGSTRIEYSARDRTGRVSTCDFYVRVSVTYCSTSQRRSFRSPGTQRCYGGERDNVYGSRCYHYCPVGYTLVGGRTSVLCQSNGRWDGSFPRCQIVSCGSPGSVSGGRVRCPAGLTYGRRCLLQCLPGYSATGHYVTTCGSNRLWSPPLEPCADTEAPKFVNGCQDMSLSSGPLSSPVTVTWPDPTVTDNSPDPVTLTSDLAKGSRLGVGGHKVTVTATDGAGNNASCTFHVTIVAKECPPLAQPANSHMTCVSGHVEGSECTVECHAGYQVQGNSSLTCLGTRQWDSAVPTCGVVQCPAKPQVEKGFFLCPQDHHQFQDVCTLTCDPGHSVSGSAVIRCQANGMWTPEGSCVDTEPPQFVSPCPPNITVFASRLGEDTNVTWSPLQASDTSGHDVNVTCDVDSGASFSPGVTVVTCTASDSSGNSRSCMFSFNVTVLQCPDPGTSLSNQSQLSFTCPDGHVFGARCTLGCIAGYSLLGEGSVECERVADTHPPLMTWRGSEGGLVTRPECKVDNCPRLDPPTHGSLSCLLGAVAWDCFMQCHSGWDVSDTTLANDGRFFCNGQTGVWVPARVPDCVVKMNPVHIKAYSDLFYVAEDCRGSEDAIRDLFIIRLTSSILRDACVNVPTCTARNVKVVCGPVTEQNRRKRAVDLGFEPQGDGDRDRVGREMRRKAVEASHYIRVSVEVMLTGLLANSSLSEQQVFQAAHQTAASLGRSLTMHASSGKLTPSHVTADVIRVSRPSLRVECPPGTVLRPRHLSADRFSCVGCAEGQYLPPGATQCQPCPDPDPDSDLASKDTPASCSP